MSEPRPTYLEVPTCAQFHAGLAIRHMSDEQLVERAELIDPTLGELAARLNSRLQALQDDTDENDLAEEVADLEEKLAEWKCEAIELGLENKALEKEIRQLRDTNARMARRLDEIEARHKAEIERRELEVDQLMDMVSTNIGEHAHD